MNDKPREFVDSNVLVYAVDSTAGQKRAAAQALLERLWNEGSGCSSVQVLQEFHVIVTRKLPSPLSLRASLERIRYLSAWPIFAPRANDVAEAVGIQLEFGFSFWDAMVAHAAAAMGCGVLWSEDLSHKQVVRGLTIRNPFH